MPCTRRIALVLLLVLAATVAGRTNIDPVLKYAWSENAGWLNWRDANSGVQGARVRSTFLTGFIWGENIGWINLGDGTPANGIQYANVDGTDFGVNIDPPTSDLYGLAWGENIGWINFDTRSSLSSFGQQARFDFSTGRFRGYAWAENIGWVNLDDGTHYVGYVPPSCSDPFADVDGDGDVDQQDFGLLQLCITGTDQISPEGCECYDRPEPGFPQGDNDVDSYDREAFEACASGPGVPAPASCAD